MQFVHNDVSECFDQAGDRRSACHKQRFEGLGSDEQRALRQLDESALYAARDVTVPWRHRCVDALEQRTEPAMLIIDERLEWRDVDDAERLRRVLSERTTDRKECGLRFPGRRRGRDQNVAPVQDRQDRPLLDLA